MWKYPFANFIFLLALITLLSIRHSVGVFGPALHTGGPGLGESASIVYRNGELAVAAIDANRITDFVDDAWRRAIALEEWWINLNSTRWEILRASGRIETDLIEARFHVSTAEVFADAMHQKERSIGELARADTLLEDAQTAAKTSLSARLSRLRTEIVAAEAKERIDTGSLETIRIDIDRLIESLRA